MEAFVFIKFLQFVFYTGSAYYAFQHIKRRSLDPLHILQLEGYDNEEYKGWLRLHRKAKIGSYVPGKENKTPLVHTQRLKRLYTNHLRLNGGILIAFLVLGAIMEKQMWWMLVHALLLFLLVRAQFLLVIWSNAISLPKEKKINQGFYDTAQEKIRNLTDLQVVGITGSFGKTSTKFILSTLLEEDFKVQNTPSSYNTPMGLSKVINDELTEDKEVFIAELGAKVPGEIRETAELVQPTIGVITAIGPTHMHLFKSLENIQNTKYELIQALPEDGTAIFNLDNDYVKALADRRERKTLGYSLKDPSADVYADHIQVGPLGSTFRLHLKGQEPVDCETKLLGEHNISNLLAAATVAHVLGMSGQRIGERIKEVEPVEHRLNLIRGGSGVIVIDDAFNSNPVGAEAALKVLAAFPEGKKLIITPGMVELGDMEDEENRKFGEKIAEVCDYAILVGPKRTLPIQQGLKDKGFDENRWFTAKTLKEATEISAHLTAPGDVILMENDLPDSYSEE